MGKKGFARRMLAVILSLCCVLGMFPTAGAANDTSATSGETKKRYVWLVSQPGIQLKVQARGGKNG